jgi:2-polyprenyl-6-methoxyphenol hydroxylase-like FAD-dependent oxidoreductase
MRVLVLEREVAFRDRVRGEQMHSWGVAEARTLGLYELLLETCGHEVRYWSDQLVGFSEFERRDLVKTSPHRAGSLYFYHPDMQAVVIGAAASAGATVRRGARVVELISNGPPGVRVHEDRNGVRVYRARLVVGADGRNSVCRRWGSFHVERDSEGMVIAGLLMEGLAAPEDRMSASRCTSPRHRPRRRAIQYSRVSVMEPRSRGILDTPPEPVIGLAEGETRWRSMTISAGAASALRVCRTHPSSTASASVTASAPSITVFSSEVACTVMFSAKNRASVT